MNYLVLCTALGLAVLCPGVCWCLEWDESGYVIYCPCMGRFGNQAEHFLGSLGFAKSINRTLVLPPWRTYRNEPFNSFFKVEPIKQYHRVILAEDFMKHLAPRHWPEGKREGWCYKSSHMDPSYACDMKKGNPFYQFWDGLSVDFDSDVYFNTSYEDAETWKRKYPADKYPVMAFKGSPARFPVLEKHVHLQQYLQWAEEIETETNVLIQSYFSDKKFIGLHLRNGIDWLKACAHIKGLKSFMSSYQCYGFNNDREIHENVCYPTEDTILSHVREIVIEKNIFIVYISTDSNSMVEEIREHLKDLSVKVHDHEGRMPQLNLAVLQKSTHFIGSCCSSFSAFVSRHRKVHNLPSTFWGYHDSSPSHSEL
ncbi:hypothetical protein LOTGIDRAFT_219361 [Lottia gigantea]|uniref:GDP-fucose protein O-fucosyltransferase 1 n=1 Tax=Lottia gigantea TaxID=225164 RepID=V4A031_LOTGI|nr:hypothetical protein LOTGIDRAFT_219361 [Lottia gigantea]ESO88280.1 hypothetical protein LOTGIDRAFT_219361 [Lottia gigantea]